MGSVAASKIRLPLLLLAAVLPIAAQVAPAQAPDRPLPTLRAVAVSGSQRFGQEQLVPATGLRLGQPSSLNQLQTAAERLAASGMFASVKYTYNYTAEATTAQFQVTDQTALLPVRFDNFVWLPSGRVLQQLRDKIPLFTGAVPLSGNIGDQVTAALHQMLIQLGLSGATVEGMPYQAQIGQTGYSAYEIFVRGVAIPLQAIDVTGLPPALAGSLRAGQADLLNANYSRSRLDSYIRATLLPDLRGHGYLQAAAADPVVQVDNQPLSGKSPVRVTINLNPGAQYHWSAIATQGNAVLSDTQIAKEIKSRPGQLANQTALTADIASIRSLYQRSGYLDATITPHFDFVQPDLARVVAQITEGPQYRMGTLTLAGVAGQAATDLTKLWKLAPGAPFDGTYLNQYVAALYRKFNLSGRSLSTSEHRDPQTHLVNIEISLAKAAGK